MYHIEIGHVTVRQTGTYCRQQRIYELSGLVDWQFGIIERCSGKSRTTGILALRNSIGIKDSVFVPILPVVLSINMKIAITAGDGVTTTCRTVDKQVICCIHIRRAFRITSHQVTSATPVVYDIIYILINALYLIISRTVIAI